MSIRDRSQGLWRMNQFAGRRQRPRRRPRGVLGLEVLEVRIVPSTISTWTGLDAGTSTNWSDANNWSGDTKPAPGNNLDFPSSAPGATNTNDIGTGIAYGSLTVAGSGYSIGGDSVALSSIDASQTSGSSTVDLPIALSGAVSVDNSGATLVLGGAITGSTGLAKNGAGTLDLTATNTYTGTTTVNTGTLLVDGTQGSSPVTVGTGATLGGTGTVGSITAGGATVDPGDGVTAGVLRDTGSLNLGKDAGSNGSTYTVYLDGTTAGDVAGDYSQTVVAGAVALNNSTLAVTLGGSFTPAVGDSFTIIQNNSTSPVNGTFNGLAQGSTITVSGTTFSVSYVGGSNSNSVVLTAVDPSTTTLSAPSSSVYGESVALQATVTGPGSDPTPTGTVQFFNGATSLGTETLASGTATLNIATLPVTTNSITVTYLGNSTYGDSTSTASAITVTAASTTTTVASFPVAPISGQSVSLTATVAPVSPGAGTPTGVVEFLSGGNSLGTATLTSGVATFKTTGLTLGGNTITADYTTDGNFASSDSSAVTVTVASTANSTTTLTSPTSSPVFGEQVTLAVTVAPTTTGTPSGSVEFLNGTAVLGTATLSGGSTDLVTTGLALGDNSITAIYSGDDTFTSSSSQTVQVTIQQADTTTAVSSYFPKSPIANQTVTLTATVSVTAPGSGTPTGTVEFLNGTDSLGTGTLSSGVATLAVSNLSTGPNSITAEYLQGTDFNGSTSPAVTVTLASTATSTTAVTYTPSSLVYGDDVTLTATVKSTTTGTPSGTVQFYNGSTLLGSGTLDGSGVASLAPTVLPAGSDQVTALYSGDSTFTSSISPVVTITVATVSTTTTVTASPSTPVFGQSVTVTATITPASTGPIAPTGTVTFYNGATSLGTETITNGAATLSTTLLPAGTNSITADYAGDTNYAKSTSSAINVPVAVASTTAAVTYFPTSPVVSQNVLLTATISAVSPGAGTPTGTVTFLNNGTTTLGTGTLSGGIATLSTSTLAAVSNSITAVYSGSGDYSGSTSPAVTITPAATPTSTTKVTVSTSTPTYGQSVTFTATVAAVTTGGSTPSGTVDFFNGTTLLGTGTLNGSAVATLPSTTLSTGANSITAQYSGDSNYTSSTSAVLTVTVSKVATSTSLQFTPSSPTLGSTVEFTATISPTTTGTALPSGTVEFFNGANELGTATVVKDSASLATTALPVGTNSITADYLGDTNYAASTSGATTVTVSEFLAVTNSPNVPTYGQATTLTATLSPTGSASPTGTVEFFSGSTPLGTGTVSNDTATLVTTALAIGNNSVTAVYSGDTNYPSSTSAVNLVGVVLSGTTTTLSVSDPNPSLSEKETITAVIAPVSPGAGTPTGTVQFYNNGNSIGTATVSGGQASLTLVLPVGSSSITASYSGDTNFEPSTASAATAVAGTADQIWLNQVYQIELGRAPSTSDYAYWDKQFAAGRTLKEAASAIVDSPEASLYRIQGYFQAYLGRDGTAQQIKAVLAESKGTSARVRAAILGSKDFYTKSGATHASFLSALEIAVLGTAVDQPFLKAHLASGVSRTVVAKEVIQSNLGKQALLTSTFQAVLDRAPTNQEIVAYVGLMNRGLDISTIVASLLAGNEFYNNATASLSALESALASSAS